MVTHVLDMLDTMCGCPMAFGVGDANSWRPMSSTRGTRCPT